MPFYIENLKPVFAGSSLGDGYLCTYLSIAVSPNVHIYHKHTFLYNVLLD